jgi:hypothetical protein
VHPGYVTVSCYCRPISPGNSHDEHSLAFLCSDRSTKIVHIVPLLSFFFFQTEAQTLTLLRSYPRIIAALLGIALSGSAYSQQAHRYYRFVIDSVGSNTDGLSSVNELQVKVGGQWLINSNDNIGSNTHGLVRFGPSAGTYYQATVDLTDECCSRDLSQLFDGIDAVAWVAGYPYGAFAIGATGDSLVADSIWAKFDFGNDPIALEGMRVFGDPWDNASAAGAEAPDRFRIQYSDNGVDYVTAYQTSEDAVTFSGTGFDAPLEIIFRDGFE